MTDAAIRREATGLLQDLIRCDTSNPPGREGQCVTVLRDYLEASGVACEIIANDRQRPNLVARIAGSGGGPSLALSGHTDVVPADEPDWRHPPFSGDLDDDGYIWGRGAVDMKSQTATNAVTVAMLARSGFTPRGDLVLIAQADEEDGTANVGMRWLVKARPDLRVDYALDEGGGGRLVLADGRVFVTIEVGQKATLALRITALGEATHASWPYMGRNAVVALATLISRVVAYRPTRQLRGPTRQMLEVLVGETTGRALDAVVAEACALDPWLARFLPALVTTTMAPTRLRGSGALNVIPARASVDVDCRPVPGATSDEIVRDLHAALGDDVPYELEVFDPLTGGADTPFPNPLYDACQSFLDSHDAAARLLPIVSTGFADSNYLRQEWGTAAFGFWPLRTTPLELYESGQHNSNERIHRDDLGYATTAQMHIVRTLIG
jgi:acetylornithine deacetylase/succinyl-diaminopimelate desuccinylase-like protein